MTATAAAPDPTPPPEAAPDRAAGPVTLFVCTTCRAGEPAQEGRPVRGARLLAALRAAAPAPGVTIRGVECLSACAQGASVALAAPGRWAYVYGGMSEADAAEILAGAALYARAPDGIVPWRARPEIFRRRSLARIPPLPAPASAMPETAP